MTWGRIILVAALIALGALVAGCGGEDQLTSDEYTEEMTALGDRADEAHQAVNAAFKAESVAKIKALLLAFADDQEAIGEAADDLEPPDDAEEANQRLADGLIAMADEIRTTVDSLSDDMTPKQALDQVDESLSDISSAEQVDSALSELKKLGYTESG